MPVWVWILLGLSVLGFVLGLLDNKAELDTTERFGRAFAILFILALLGGLILSFLNADWQ
jgi:hypothetical protein